MKESYRISIPNPCHQSWDNMIPADKGRHCMQCSKTVIDFSVMTDGEIISFLQQQRNQSVCGRFMNTQLEKSYRPPSQPFLPAVYRKLLLALGLTVSLHQSLSAQQGVGEKRGRVAMSPQAKTVNPMVISGTVRGSNGLLWPPKVEVSADSFQKSIIIDEHGRFSIELPAIELRERVVIKISAEAYETQTYYGVAAMPANDPNARPIPNSNFLDVVLVVNDIERITNAIERMPVRSTENVAAATTAGTVSFGDGGLSIQGARGEVLYYVDGIQIRGGIQVPDKQPKKKTFWQRLKFWK